MACNKKNVKALKRWLRGQGVIASVMTGCTDPWIRMRAGPMVKLMQKMQQQARDLKATTPPQSEEAGL